MLVGICCAEASSPLVPVLCAHAGDGRQGVFAEKRKVGRQNDYDLWQTVRPINIIKNVIYTHVL